MATAAEANKAEHRRLQQQQQRLPQKEIVCEKRKHLQLRDSQAHSTVKYSAY